jgi:hypothetical protein
MVIEVDEVEDLYDRARRANVPIPRELGKASWGHLSFCVREPNGLTLYFFESLADASSV